MSVIVVFLRPLGLRLADWGGSKQTKRVNRRFVGGRLKPFIAMDDDETHER